MTNRPGILSEFTLLIKEHKAFWLVPILIMTLLFSLLVIAGGTAIAPFIYTIF